MSTPQGLAITVALIGLAGTFLAVLATIITQAIATRSARTTAEAQLKFQREQHDASLKSAEASRFEDVKREAFTRHLRNAGRLNHFLRAQDQLSLPEKVLGRDPYLGPIQQFVDEYTASGEEIILLAPELLQQVGRVSDLLVARARDESIRKHYSDDAAAQADIEIAKLREQMQANLGIQLPTPMADNQKG